MDNGTDLLVISRADLYAVYAYAQHFDVEDDPVMVRIKAALESGYYVRPGSEVAQVRSGLDLPGQSQTNSVLSQIRFS